MDIEGIPEIKCAHRRTLYVPARPARPEGRIPGGFALFGGLPENKVKRVSLLLVHLDPCPCDHIFEGALGELTVVAVTIHGKVDIPVDSIGMTLAYQGFHKGYHVTDMLRGARLVLRSEHPQGVHVLIDRADVRRAHLPPGYCLRMRALDYLVVDVGEVPHVGRAEPLRAEVTYMYRRRWRSWRGRYGSGRTR